MAMKRVKQSEVTWVPRDKKTGKGGFLALRSDKSKPFSGVVTGVKKGTTAASASGEAVYRGGKNIRKVASREATKRAAVPRPSVTDRSKTTPAAVKSPTKAMPSVSAADYAKYAAARRESRGRNTSVGPVDAFIKSAVSKFNPANRFGAAASKPGGPKKGDKKTMTVNGKKKTVTFNGKRWV